MEGKSTGDHKMKTCVINNFRASSVPTFGDNLLVPSPVIKMSKKKAFCPETSVQNIIQRCVIPQKSADIYIAAEA
jgi:hypothetical protein